jgi:hypothetical protein
MKKFLLLFVVFLATALAANAQVTPPAGVEQTEFAFMGTLHDAYYGDMEVDEHVMVAVDGTDIYLQLPNPVNGLAWIKGTINGETATFPKQVLGQNGGTSYYITALYDGDVVGDITFAYTETLMTCFDQYIQISDDLAGKNVYSYFTNVMVILPGEDDPVVEAPDGLQASPYIFTGNMRQNDEEGNYIGYQEVKRALKIGFWNNNTEVYVQGLCQYLPTAWVKGKVEDGSFGDKQVTFKKAQCYGKYGLYPLYIGAAYGSYVTDMVFIYDPQTRIFTNDAGRYLVTYTNKQEPQPVDWYFTATMAPGIYSAIQSVEADKATDAAAYTLDGLRVNSNYKGLVIKNGKKVVMK